MYKYLFLDWGGPYDLIHHFSCEKPYFCFHVTISTSTFPSPGSVLCCGSLHRVCSFSFFVEALFKKSWCNRIFLFGPAGGFCKTRQYETDQSVEVFVLERFLQSRTNWGNSWPADYETWPSSVLLKLQGIMKVILTFIFMLLCIWTVTYLTIETFAYLALPALPRKF